MHAMTLNNMYCTTTSKSQNTKSESEANMGCLSLGKNNNKTKKNYIKYISLYSFYTYKQTN